MFLKRYNQTPVWSIVLYTFQQQDWVVLSLCTHNIWTFLPVSASRYGYHWRNCQNAIWIIDRADTNITFRKAYWLAESTIWARKSGSKAPVHRWTNPWSTQIVISYCMAHFDALAAAARSKLVVESSNEYEKAIRVPSWLQDSIRIEKVVHKLFVSFG